MGAPAETYKSTSQHAAVTDPTLEASEVALLKGLLKQLQGTGAGNQPVSIAGGTLPTVTTVTTVGTVTTANTVPKALLQTETVANITVATPFAGTNRDAGSALTYQTYRLRIFADQPLKVDVHAGASSTLTSNRIQQTINVPANTMTVVDVPLLTRYAGIRVTNTGAATTTAVEILSALIAAVK